MIETMQPGANGVLKNIHKLSKEDFRKGSMYFVELFLTHIDPEYNLEPLTEDELAEEDEFEQNYEDYHDEPELDSDQLLKNNEKDENEGVSRDEL